MAKPTHIALAPLVQTLVNFVNNVITIEDNDDEVFNEHLKLIQGTLGQPDGDEAALFFSNEKWFDDYNSASGFAERYNLINEYVLVELEIFKNKLRVSGGA